MNKLRKSKTFSPSKGQWLVLAIGILLSLVILLTAKGIKQLSDPKIDVQLPSMVDLLKKKTPTFQVIIANPTPIPFRILPFSAEVKILPDQTIARLQCAEAVTIKPLSDTYIPLQLHKKAPLDLSQMAAMLKKSVQVEGTVTVSVFGIKKKVPFRKIYAVPRMP